MANNPILDILGQTEEEDLMLPQPEASALPGVVPPPVEDVPLQLPELNFPGPPTSTPIQNFQEPEAWQWMRDQMAGVQPQAQAPQGLPSALPPIPTSEGQEAPSGGGYLPSPIDALWKGAYSLGGLATGLAALTSAGVGRIPGVDTTDTTQMLIDGAAQLEERAAKYGERINNPLQVLSGMFGQGDMNPIEAWGKAPATMLDVLAEQAPLLVTTFGVGGVAGIGAKGILQKIAVQGGKSTAKRMANSAEKWVLKEGMREARKSMGRTVYKKAVKEGLEETIRGTLKRDLTGSMIKRYAAKRGMDIGVVGTMGSLEAGGMFSEAAQRVGVDEASVSKAWGYGMAAGWMELAFGGGNLRAIRKYVGPAAEKEARKIAARAAVADSAEMPGLVKKAVRLIEPVLAGGGVEAFQEGGQEIAALFNVASQDPTMGLFTDESIHRIGESMATGLFMGVGPAMGEAYLGRQKTPEGATETEDVSDLVKPEGKLPEQYTINDLTADELEALKMHGVNYFDAIDSLEEADRTGRNIEDLQALGTIPEGETVANYRNPEFLLERFINAGGDVTDVDGTTRTLSPRDALNNLGKKYIKDFKLRTEINAVTGEASAPAPSTEDVPMRSAMPDVKEGITVENINRLREEETARLTEWVAKRKKAALITEAKKKFGEGWTSQRKGTAQIIQELVDLKYPPIDGTFNVNAPDVAEPNFILGGLPVPVTTALDPSVMPAPPPGAMLGPEDLSQAISAAGRESALPGAPQAMLGMEDLMAEINLAQDPELAALANTILDTAQGRQATGAVTFGEEGMITPEQAAEMPALGGKQKRAPKKAKPKEEPPAPVVAPTEPPPTTPPAPAPAGAEAAPPTTRAKAPTAKAEVAPPGKPAEAAEPAPAISDEEKKAVLKIARKRKSYVTTEEDKKVLLDAGKKLGIEKGKKGWPKFRKEIKNALEPVKRGSRIWLQREAADKLGIKFPESRKMSNEVLKEKLGYVDEEVSVTEPKGAAKQPVTISLPEERGEPGVEEEVTKAEDEALPTEYTEGKVYVNKRTGQEHTVVSEEPKVIVLKNEKTGKDITVAKAGLNKAFDEQKAEDEVRPAEAPAGFGEAPAKTTINLESEDIFKTAADAAGVVLPADEEAAPGRDPNAFTIEDGAGEEMEIYYGDVLSVADEMASVQRDPDSFSLEAEIVQDLGRINKAAGTLLKQKQTQVPRGYPLGQQLFTRGKDPVSAVVTDISGGLYTIKIQGEPQAKKYTLENAKSKFKLPKRKKGEGPSTIGDMNPQFQLDSWDSVKQVIGGQVIDAIKSLYSSKGMKKAPDASIMKWFGKEYEKRMASRQFNDDVGALVEEVAVNAGHVLERSAMTEIVERSSSRSSTRSAAPSDEQKEQALWIERESLIEALETISQESVFATMYTQFVAPLELYINPESIYTDNKDANALLDAMAEVAAIKEEVTAEEAKGKKASRDKIAKLSTQGRAAEARYRNLKDSLGDVKGEEAAELAELMNRAIQHLMVKFKMTEEDARGAIKGSEAVQKDKVLQKALGEEKEAGTFLTSMVNRLKSGAVPQTFSPAMLEPIARIYAKNKSDYTAVDQKRWEDIFYQIWGTLTDVAKEGASVEYDISQYHRKRLKKDQRTPLKQTEFPLPAGWKATAVWSGDVARFMKAVESHAFEAVTKKRGQKVKEENAIPERPYAIDLVGKEVWIDVRNLTAEHVGAIQEAIVRKETGGYLDEAFSASHKKTTARLVEIENEAAPDVAELKKMRKQAYKDSKAQKITFGQALTNLGADPIIARLSPLNTEQKALQKKQSENLAAAIKRAEKAISKREAAVASIAEITVQPKLFASKAAKAALTRDVARLFDGHSPQTLLGKTSSAAAMRPNDWKKIVILVNQEKQKETFSGERRELIAKAKTIGVLDWYRSQFGDEAHAALVKKEPTVITDETTEARRKILKAGPVKHTVGGLEKLNLTQLREFIAETARWNKERELGEGVRKPSVDIAEVLKGISTKPKKYGPKRPSIATQKAEAREKKAAIDKAEAERVAAAMKKSEEKAKKEALARAAKKKESRPGIEFADEETEGLTPEMEEARVLVGETGRPPGGFKSQAEIEAERGQQKPDFIAEQERNDLSVEESAVKLKAGDVTQMGHLWTQLTPRIKKSLYKAKVPQERHDDAISDILLTVLDPEAGAIKSWNPNEGSFSAWFYRVAYFQALNNLEASLKEADKKELYKNMLPSVRDRGKPTPKADYKELGEEPSSSSSKLGKLSINEERFDGEKEERQAAKREQEAEGVKEATEDAGALDLAPPHTTLINDAVKDFVLGERIAAGHNAEKVAEDIKTIRPMQRKANVEQKAGRAIARWLGYRVYYTDNLIYGGHANGIWLPQYKAVYVDSTVKSPLITIGHEIYHGLQEAAENDPVFAKKFNKYNVILREATLRTARGRKLFDKKKEAFKRLYAPAMESALKRPLTEQEIVDGTWAEYRADLTGHALMHQEFYDHIKQKDRNLYGRLYSIIMKIWKRVATFTQISKVEDYLWDVPGTAESAWETLASIVKAKEEFSEREVGPGLAEVAEAAAALFSEYAHNEKEGRTVVKGSRHREAAHAPVRTFRKDSKVLGTTFGQVINWLKTGDTKAIDAINSGLTSGKISHREVEHNLVKAINDAMSRNPKDILDYHKAMARMDMILNPDAYADDIVAFNEYMGERADISTDGAAFKSWFGKSEVNVGLLRKTREDMQNSGDIAALTLQNPEEIHAGKKPSDPIALVHATYTPLDFDEFSIDHSTIQFTGADGKKYGAFFFTMSPKSAAELSNRHQGIADGVPTSEAGLRTMPAYLSVQKLFDFNNEAHINGVMDWLRDNYHLYFADIIIDDPMSAPAHALKIQTEGEPGIGGYEEAISALKRGDWWIYEHPQFLKHLHELGYDGTLIYAGGMNVVVFDPAQIKSVNNKGTWLRTSNKIRMDMHDMENDAVEMTPPANDNSVSSSAHERFNKNINPMFMMPNLKSVKEYNKGRQAADNDTPFGFFNKLKKKRYGPAADHRTLGWLERTISNPWHIAKRFPKLEDLLWVEQNRQEEKNMLEHEWTQAQLPKTHQLHKAALARARRNKKFFLPRAPMHEFLMLKKKEAEVTLEAIQLSDKYNQYFKDDELRAGEFEVLVDGKITTVKMSKGPLTQKQIDAYHAVKMTMDKIIAERHKRAEAILSSPYKRTAFYHDLVAALAEYDKALKVTVNKAQSAPEDDAITVEPPSDSEVQAILEKHSKYLTKKDTKKFASVFNRITKDKGDTGLSNAQQLRRLREQWGRLKFYFPRMRENTPYRIDIKYGIGANERTIAHFRAKSKADVPRVISYLKKDSYYGKLLSTKSAYRIEYEYDPKPQEDIFAEISDVSTEAFINSAIAKLQESGEMDEGLAQKLTDQVFEQIGTEIKARGFARHSIRRADRYIPGFKTDQGQKMFVEYFSGAAGFVTKQQAAWEFFDNLSRIDSSKESELWSYANNFAKDMLRNTEAIDRFSGHLRGGMFLYFLSGHLKAPMVNLTQNWVTGVPWLARYTGDMKSAHKIYMKAMKDGGAYLFNPENTTGLSEEEAKALHTAIIRGITIDQYMREVMGRAEGAFTGAYAEITDKLSWAFSKMEQTNRVAAFLAAYRVSRSNGATEAKAFRAAQKFVYDVHYLMGKSNLPEFARGPGKLSRVVGRNAMVFRSFTHNYLLSMAQSISKDGQFSPDVVLRSFAFLSLFAGALSLPFLEDLLEMAEAIFKRPFRAEARKAMDGGASEMLYTFGVSGIPGMLGADISGSLKIQRPWKPSEAVFGVWSGMYHRVGQAKDAALAGDLSRAGEYLAPIAVSNVMRATRSFKHPVTTPSGQVVTDWEGNEFQYNLVEATWRALGFRPTRESIVYLDSRSKEFILQMFDQQKTRIYRQYSIAKHEGEKADMADAKKKGQEWNKEVARLGLSGKLSKITHRTFETSYRRKQQGKRKRTKD